MLGQIRQEITAVRKSRVAHHFEGPGLGVSVQSSQMVVQLGARAQLLVLEQLRAASLVTIGSNAGVLVIASQRALLWLCGPSHCFQVTTVVNSSCVSACCAAQVLLRDKMNILLLLLPLALVSHGVKWPAGVTFVLALLPLCSLAEVSSSCTVDNQLR